MAFDAGELGTSEKNFAKRKGEARTSGRRKRPRAAEEGGSKASSSATVWAGLRFRAVTGRYLFQKNSFFLNNSAVGLDPTGLPFKISGLDTAFK